MIEFTRNQRSNFEIYAIAEYYKLYKRGIRSSSSWKLRM